MKRLDEEVIDFGREFPGCDNPNINTVAREQQNLCLRESRDITQKIIINFFISHDNNITYNRGIIR